MNIALLLNFARQDLIERYAGSILGGAWSFLMPLANIFIFTVIFSNIMQMRMPQFDSPYAYSIYLVVGVLAWNSFAATVSRVTNVYRDKGGLIKKVKLSLVHLPLFVLLSELVIYVISMGIFFIFLMLIGYPFERTLLFVPVIYAVQQLFAYALGFLLASFSVFLRDIREFVSILLQFWFWLTPIVYVLKILPDSVTRFVMLNPAFIFIDAYHSVFMSHELPSAGPLLSLALVAALLLALAWFVCRKLERDIRDFI